jgi:hypothetical protein
MEAVTFLHYLLVDNPLNISYSNPVKKLIDTQSDVFYYELDNFSGEDVLGYAKMLAKNSKSIIIFIQSVTTTNDHKLAAWLNFLLQLQQDKVLIWQGENAIIEQMKSAFDRKLEISDLKQLIKQINLQLNRS